MSQGASDLKDYGLHFDLTVPFARYTLDREHALTFPFKRYQIQPVWRGERAQKGRFREFFQCDIDVIWKGEKDYLYYDAEIIATLGQTLTNIIQSTNLNDNITFHINNKKIVKSFLAEISENPEQAQTISNLIDKFDKIGAEKFESSLIEDLNISGGTKDKILTFISFCTPELEKLNELKKLSSNETFQQGINELETVLSLLDQFLKLPSTKCLLLDQSAEDEDMQISPDISTLKDKITVEYEEVSGSVEFSVESLTKLISNSKLLQTISSSILKIVLKPDSLSYLTSNLKDIILNTIHIQTNLENNLPMRIKKESLLSLSAEREKKSKESIK